MSKNFETEKRGWDRFEEKKKTKEKTVKKRMGLGRSYTFCIAGGALWALMQLGSILLTAFGLAQAFLWLTVSFNALKFAGMLLFALGLFFVRRNAAPERRQPLGSAMIWLAGFTVAASVFRIVVLEAFYGGFNTAGKAVYLALCGLMLAEYRKKPPFMEKMWKLAGATAGVCYTAAGLMGVMLVSLQLLGYSFFQYVFTVSFYGAEGLELIAVVMLAIYYAERKRLVRKKI